MAKDGRGHREGSATAAPRQALGRCDGQHLRAAIDSAAAWLLAHAQEVDALNVYPVPDGDTGSNMSQTLRAAVDEAATSKTSHVGEYVAHLAHGALMGARGNSGVILSQLLRGFAHTLAGKRTFTATDLARALQEASTTAYRAVIRPVEGTILSVARVAAEHAVQAAAEQPDFLHVLDNAVSGGRKALAETQDQLPVLRQAGVVDAGGQGYLFILEGALRHLQSKHEETVAPAQASATLPSPHHATIEHQLDSYGYCTEFLIVGRGLRENEIRERLMSMGDSLLVVGDDDLLRVHIHTDDPGAVLSFAASLGRLRQVKIDDMQAQHDTFAADSEAPDGHRVPLTLVPQPESAAMPLPIGVVAVTMGTGFEELFRSLGAIVVSGGSTMNPSTEQILSAIENCSQDTVIVLPNNSNVLLTARQAATLSTKTIHVLPTHTIPQGIAALLAVRYDDESDAMLAAMGDAATHTRTIEVTTAVRDAEIDGLRVRRGDVLGLLDGVPTAAGIDRGSVVSDLMDRLPAEHYEIITVYAGAEATPGECRALLELLTSRYPALHVEQHDGGQPHYQFILSVE